jgi:hypothetical protein
MCRTGGPRCDGSHKSRTHLTDPHAEGERYTQRAYDLDAAAARGEDIGERLANEKLARDNAMAEEIARSLGGR